MASENLKLRFKNFKNTLNEINKNTKKPEIQVFLDILRCFILFGMHYSDYESLRFYEISDKEKRDILRNPERKILGEGISFVKVVYILFLSAILYFCFEYSPLWSLCFYFIVYRCIDIDRFSVTVIKLLAIGFILAVLYSLLFYWTYFDYLDGHNFIDVLGIIGRVGIIMVPEVFLAGILSDYVVFPLIDRFVESLEYKTGLVLTIIVGIFVILAVIMVIILTYAYLFLI